MQNERTLLRLHPWPVWHIFPHYRSNGTILGKKVIEHKIYVLMFSTTSA